MEAKILARLNGINQEFYQTFAQSFSQTRRRVQPGVRRVLTQMPKEGNFLDIGCGNGNLAKIWARDGYRGSFSGVDFSPGLIADAKKNIKDANDSQSISFYEADISSEKWALFLPDQTWDAIFSFAVLHHIPSADRRLRLCQQIHAIADPGTQIWVSVWQPLNSPRLRKRILGWQEVGIDREQVEHGDVLMDWRAYQDSQKSPAIRYVHIYDESELQNLAEAAGFAVDEKFFSDGKEGNLGLYQRWAAKY